MASDRQVAANQRNALKSTGPKTAEGKASAAKNALKHGARAMKVIADYEDREAFVSLLTSLQETFDPRTAVEEELVQSLAMAFWRGRRLAEAERVAMDVGVENPADPSFIVVKSFDRIMREKGVLPIDQSVLFGRYQTMLTNEVQRLLLMIRQEQDLRAQALEAQVIDVGPSTDHT